MGKGPKEQTRTLSVEFPAIGEEAHSVNIGQHYITTTEDKMRLALQRLVTIAEARIKGRERMIAPFTTLLALVLALTTSNFKAGFWFVFAVFLTGGVFVWLIVAIGISQQTETFSIENCIQQLSGDAPDNVRPFSTTSGRSPEVS